MYADTITDSMKLAITETNRRREIQHQFNIEHNITPQTIHKAIKNTLEISQKDTKSHYKEKDIPKQIEKLNGLMISASKQLDFERAILLRDEITQLKKLLNKSKI